MTILELSARCESATAEEQKAALFEIYEEAAKGDTAWLTHDLATRFLQYLSAEAYESAALALVPEGWNRSISSIAGKPPSVRLWNDESDIAVWRANTEALAICAAALRARAA